MKKRAKKNSLNFPIILLIIILILFSTITLILLYQDKIKYNENIQDNQSIDYDNNYVSRVIDGDTIELSTGEIIRLICIDSPERNLKGYLESKEFLESLVLNKNIRLESDNDDKDKYNRSLRYVYVNSSDKEIFVNKELVKQGYATLFPYLNNTKKCNEISS